MGFDELCELGSSGFLSIDVQLGQPLFLLSDVKLDVSNELLLAGRLALSGTSRRVLSTCNRSPELVAQAVLCTLSYAQCRRFCDGIQLAICGATGYKFVASRGLTP